MKIVFLTNGTRGDIQPLIYLGQELVKKKHETVIVASDNFRSLIQESGLTHFSMPVNLQEYMETEEGRVWIGRISKNPIDMISGFRKMIPTLAESTLNAYWQASQDADLLLTTTGALGDVIIRDYLKVPLVEVQLQPLEATADFPYPLLNFPFSSRLFNKLTYLLFERQLALLFKSSLQKWQKTQFNRIIKFKGGPFAERRRCADLKLGAFSAQLVQRPLDWPENYYICGNFFPDESNEYPEDSKLKDFILDGSPPVYIGFGSMIISDPQKVTDLIRKLINQTGLRIVFSKGWSSLNLEDIPGKLIQIDNVPHSWLFPKMMGIIHHGGAGTTAACLRAGVPQMIIPKTADQPFWAQRVYEAGLSLKPLKTEKLDQIMIKDIFDFFQSTEIRKKAEKMKYLCLQENGKIRAAELIESLL